MNQKELLALLRSGDFTIAYHDNGQCSIYRGRHTYDKLDGKVEVALLSYTDAKGYLPPEVELLTKALGGKSDSI